MSLPPTALDNTTKPPPWPRIRQPHPLITPRRTPTVKSRLMSPLGRLCLAALLLLMACLALSSGSVAAQSPSPDGEESATGPTKDEGPTTGADPSFVLRPSSAPAVDLATYPAKRWIVQLAAEPLASYTGGALGLDGLTK